VCIHTDPNSALTRNFYAIDHLFKLYSLSFTPTSTITHIKSAMSDPTPAQNRSKRTLSPSAASPPRDRTRFAPYSDKPFSITPKPAPTNASATRARMIALEPDQKDTLLKTLFDLHPSARESIAAILPSITSAPLPASMISKSVYFGDKVAWCHEYLNNYNWPNNLKLPAEGSCQGSAAVLYEAALDFKFAFDSTCYRDRMFREHGCNEAEYSMDATIALLEIALLAFERQSRLGPEHGSICERIKDYRSLPRLETEGWICAVEFSFFELGDVWQYCVLPRVPDGMADRIHSQRSASPEEVADYLAVWEVWHIAIRYLTRDNEPHPLRETLLKYIDLPPILPHPGPNDNAIPESDDWLRPCLDKLAFDIALKKMPDRRPGPVLDLEGMSIT